MLYQDSIKAPWHGALLRSLCELPFPNKARGLVWLSMDPTIRNPGAAQEGQCHSCGRAKQLLEELQVPLMDSTVCSTNSLVHQLLSPGHL